MSKFAKILVSSGIVIVFLLLYAAVVGGRNASGHQTPGIFGLILLAGTYGAIRAIWKSDKKDDKNGDSSILQK